MSNYGSKPPPLRPLGPVGLNITAGRIGGTTVVHKFGADLATPTTFTPISRGGVYVMRQVAGAATVRIKAGGNANDTAAGSGARGVTINGLDETGAEVTETVATAGTSASSATTATFIRVFRAWVSTAGTYATVSGATSGSQAADIVIEDSSGTEDWATIPLHVFGMAQTTIGCYSVPLGKTAYVQSLLLQVDTNKTVDFMFYTRANILETAAPYTALRMRFGAFGVADNISLQPETPLGGYAALTDILFMARVGAGTGICAVDYEIILEDA